MDGHWPAAAAAAEKIELKAVGNTHRLAYQTITKRHTHTNKFDGMANGKVY